MAALISVVVLLAVLYGITAASYNQALIFADNVPKYSQKIRSILQPYQQQAEKLEKTGEVVGSPRTRMLCRCGRCRVGPRRLPTEPAL